MARFSFNPRLFKAQIVTLGILVAAWVFQMGVPAPALVKMDKESIDLALKYGMQNQTMGYRNLLGGNWIEGKDGVLLNIYTPFMMLAAKTYHGGFPEEPSDTDMKKARDKYARLVTNFTDPKYKKEVKFSVAMYGDDPVFAAGYRAKIKGFGRGKIFVLNPTRQYPQKEAAFDTEASSRPYEAISTYYFSFDDISILDDYTFILEDGVHPTIEFKVQNDSIY